MARYTTTASVQLSINGKQANEMIDRIKKQSVALRQDLDKAAAAGDKVRMQKITKDLRENDKLLRQLSTEAKTAAEVVARLDKASPKELRKTLSTLQNQLNKLERGSEAWKKQQQAIAAVKDELKSINEEMQAYQSDETFVDKLKAKFDEMGGSVAAVLATITGAIMAAKSAVDIYAEMQQEEANVMKFTGMDEGQVKALNEELKKIDTRTSREELNKLAQEAGRLGKTTQEDVLGFVVASNQLNVALDDLGEGATLTLSKLTSIFGVEQELGTERSLLAVGSVINDLSQNCTASAGYLAEFGKRMAGVGAQAGLTIPQIMAFAAVLDSQGQNVEASSTALQALIMKMYSAPAKIAKAAGIDVKKFSDTVKRDINEALLLLLDTLSKYGGMDKLSTIFADMGADGARSSATIAALAGKVEMLKWEQEQASAAFADATSVTKEYDVQNNTVQAGLEKSQNALKELTVLLGEKLEPGVSRMMSLGSGAIGMLSTLVSFIFRHIGALTAGAVTYGIYTAAVHANTIATGANTIATKAWALIQKSIPAVVALGRLAIVGLINVVQYFTNGLQVNIAMQLRWQAAMTASKAAMGWIGLSIAAVTAAIVAFQRWSDKLKANIEAMRARKQALADMRNYDEKAAEYYAQETTQLKALYDAATNETKSKTERINAAQKLLALYPKQFDNLSTEAIMLGKAKRNYDELTKSILRNAEAKAAAELVKENYKKIIQLRLELKSEQAAANADKAELNKANGINTQRRQQVDKTATSVTGALAMGAGAMSEGTLPELIDTTELSESLRGHNKRIREIVRDLIDYTNTNNEISKAYKDNKTFNDQLTKSDNATTTTIEAPQSQKAAREAKKAADKEKREREKKQRAAKIKAKKEFKDALDSAKGDRDKAIAEVEASYSIGAIDYLTYIEKIAEADKKFFDDTAKVYVQHNLQEDDDYAKLLRDKEEKMKKHMETAVNLTKEGIRLQEAADIQNRQFSYDLIREKTIADELALMHDLLEIRVNAAREEQKLYEKNSKEWVDLEQKITQMVTDDVLKKHKMLKEAADKFRSEFDENQEYTSLQIELQVLKKLYEEKGKNGEKMMTEEEFQKWKEQLEKKMAIVGPGAKTQREFRSSKINDLSGKYQRDLTSLDALKLGEGDYAERASQLSTNFAKGVLEEISKVESEWVKMCASMGSAWVEMLDTLSSDATTGEKIEAIAGVARQIASVMTSVLSQISEFQKAQSDIQLKTIETRYEKEIALAEGNNYLQKKLQKQRDAEIAKEKQEQTKKAMNIQIIMAIAQAAANAVQAYGAALAIPGIGLAMAPIAAGLAAAQGAVQIALIRKQAEAANSAGYAEGGFTRKGGKYEPAGIVHAGEWVASQKLVNSPEARPLINLLEHAQRTNSVASLTMDSVSRTISAPVVAAYAPAPAPVVPTLMSGANKVDTSKLEQTLAKLETRLNDPFVTVNTIEGDYGIKQAQERHARLMSNKSRRVR